MPTLAKRNAIIDDIDAALLLTSYNLLYEISDIPDVTPVYKTKLIFTITIRCS
jgi:hypothetical protein